MKAGNLYLMRVSNFSGKPEEVNCQILRTFAAQAEFTKAWEEQAAKVACEKKELEKEQGLV